MLAVDSSIDQIETWGGREIAEDLHPGEYFRVLVRSHDVTGNFDLYQVWRRLGREASILSQNRAARQPELSRELVEAELVAVDRIVTDVVKRMVTSVNSVFTGELFGGPMGHRFGDTPIRWPGENEEALSVIRAMAGAMYQIPRVRSNSLDQGIPRGAGLVIVMPLFHQKRRIMTEHFGIEVQGRVSPDEMDAIFRQRDVRPPVTSSLRDRHDTPATSAAEDAAARGNESAPTPTDDALREVKEGKEVWTWVPSENEWMTFDRIREQMNPEGPVDQPGPIFPFSPKIIEGSPATGSTVGQPVGGALTK